MMVNCPKCSLLQPKDQYCARCGINMETWQPPPKPIWKKILGNWMVQLAILFSIIFFIVLRDNLKNGTPQLDPAPPPVAQQNLSSEPTQSFQSDSPPAATTQKPEEVTTIKKRPTAASTASPQTVEENNSTESLQKKATLQVFLLSRNLIEKLAQNSQRLSEVAMILPRVLLDKTLTENRREFQAIGSIRKSFETEQPTPFFVGEEDLETGLNLGFFLQANVDSASNKNRIQVDTRQWSQLQLSGEMGPQSITLATLSDQSSLVILELGANDVEFSSEERSLFEASPKLRSLNENSFAEGLSEIALVLTIE